MAPSVSTLTPVTVSLTGAEAMVYCDSVLRSRGYLVLVQLRQKKKRTASCTCSWFLVKCASDAVGANSGEANLNVCAPASQSRQSSPLPPAGMARAIKGGWSRGRHLGDDPCHRHFSF